MLKYKRVDKYTKPKNIKELLILAREKEKSSFGFYEDMLKHSFALSIRELIEDLKNQELGHMRKIEDALERIDNP
ncbi:MAG: hypothetical protein AB1629_07965 [Candidatus Omnitrophota bacterium]